MELIKHGHELVRLRRRLSLSQTDVADLIDVSRNTIGVWEHSEDLPILISHALTHILQAILEKRTADATIQAQIEGKAPTGPIDLAEIETD